MKAIITLILIIILFTVSSCEKKVKDYNSVTGSWRCEEFNPLIGIRVYLVDIDRKRSDSTIYLLSNFHNQDSEESIEFIYARLIDSMLIIPPQDFAGLSLKSGTGKISEDFRLIEFDYNIFDGMNDIRIKADYTRPD